MAVTVRRDEASSRIQKVDYAATIDFRCFHCSGDLTVWHQCHVEASLLCDGIVCAVQHVNCQARDEGICVATISHRLSTLEQVMALDCVFHSHCLHDLILRAVTTLQPYCSHKRAASGARWLFVRQRRHSDAACANNNNNILPNDWSCSSELALPQI